MWYKKSFASGKNRIASEGLAQHSVIQMITESAIKYWSENDFTILKGESDKHNYYQAINKRYPAAWQALKTLGSMTELATDFNQVRPHLDAAIIEQIKQSDVDFEPDRLQLDIQDGYSTKFDTSLLTVLKSMSEDRLGFFYSDSFKMVSRNYEKLLRTIEFCLHCQKPFITSNYFISYGHVEKRARLLPVAHQRKGFVEKTDLVAGTRGLHREMMKQIPTYDY